MQAKSLLLAVALITLPAATAFAQSAADQPAPMQGPAATPAPSPSDTAPNQATEAQTSPGIPAGAAVPATPADLKVGAVVNDATGAKVGTIESVSRAGGVVSTGTARAQIALASFAKNAQGLVIGMTKTQLEAAVAKAKS